MGVWRYVGVENYLEICRVKILDLVTANFQTLIASLVPNYILNKIIMQKQEFETIISEQLALFKSLKEEFISTQQYEVGANLRGIEKYLIDITKMIEEKKERIPKFAKTPNFFEGNYSVGRFHTAMLAYIIELGNNGKGRDLAKKIFDGFLDFKDGVKYYPKFEYKNVDLVIFKDENYKNPVLLIEIKVDDYESWKKDGDTYINQLQMYDKAFNDSATKFNDFIPKRMFLRLGIGQYSGKPSSDNWSTELNLEILTELLEKHKEDVFLDQWYQILKKEVDFKKEVFDNSFNPIDKTESIKNRAFIYKYGKLIEKLQEKDKENYNNCSAFMYGQRPDFILNFGYDSAIYMEITNSLKLRVKINKDQLKTNFDDLLKEFREIFGNKIHLRIREGKAVTIYEKDLGLNFNSFFETEFATDLLDTIEAVRIDLEIMRKIITEQKN